MRYFMVGTAALLVSCGGNRTASPSPAQTARAPETSVLAPAPIDSSMMIRTASGLQYRDLVVGSGPTVTNGQMVTVHYIGQLLNGTQFDASVPPAAPIRFQVGVGRVIRGWDEGLLGMRVGGRRQLVIPPALGYGLRGMGPIPANSVLVFVIEVVAAN